MDLNVQDWKEFKIPSLFDVDAGIYHYSDEYEDEEEDIIYSNDYILCNHVWFSGSTRLAGAGRQDRTSYSGITLL